MDDNFTAMSVDELWGAIKGTSVLGIEGYEVPKIYQDPKKQIMERKYNKSLQRSIGQ
jgi:hypothetical protein